MTRKIFSVDPYSLASIQLCSYYNDQKLSAATCFLYKYSGQSYLVSNWHVFSGRNRYTGQSALKNGAIPNRVGIRPSPTINFMQSEPKYEIGKGYIAELSFNILDDAGDPIWLQHPVFGQEIDISVLKIDIDALSYSQYEYSNSNVSSDVINPYVSADVFIVGFPLNLSIMDYLPVWKRGTIASDYEIDVDFKPMFYVDSKTNSGMSGSPVYLRSNSVVAETQLRNGQIEYNYTELIGVYSGRVNSPNRTENQNKNCDKYHEQSLEIGEVWKSNLIDEIIAGSVRGHFKIK